MPAHQRPLLNPMLHQAYRIRSWSELFETGESRQRTGPMDWVKMRTKHDGRSYRRATRLRNANNALLGWYLILQLAGKMPCRGLLADLDGPLDVQDMADKTGIDKKVFGTALTELSKPEIGWIEEVEWVPESGFWENVGRLGMEPDYIRRKRDDAGRKRTKRDDKNGRSVPRDDGRSETPPAGAGRNGTTPDDTPPNYVHNSTRQEKTVPSAVSLAGRPEAAEEEQLPPDGLIRNTILAKALICKKILGGKNPGRLWSPDAENRLAIFCEKGIPLAEIETIAAYRDVPKDEAIPELARRSEVITETALMNFWGDELARAEAYLKKYGRSNGKRPEPPRWRECMRWLHGDQVVMPASFWKLPRDLRDECMAHLDKLPAVPAAKEEAA